MRQGSLYPRTTIVFLVMCWLSFALSFSYTRFRGILHLKLICNLSVLNLELSISNGTLSTKIYDIRDDYDFAIENFPFLDGDVPRHASYGVYISQLIRFARASSNVSDFSCRNKALTAKLLRHDYRYQRRKTFAKCYRRHSGLVEKYNVSFRKLLQQEISEPEFYGDLVYRIRKQCGDI